MAISSARCKITAPEAYMKKIKQCRLARMRRPGFTGVAVNRGANLGLMAFRSLAACALMIQCLNPALASDALSVKESGAQIAPVQKPAYVPKGRQMERYKAFARQAEMPAILISNKTTIEVGGAVKTDLNRLAQLSDREKEALAGQFGVPVGVIGKVMERAATNASPGAAQVVQNIRTAVIDYRFLEGEWGRYHPSAEGQQLKADALAALKAGDINKAWELYDGLQRPAPPTNLRVVAHP
jgi:hypothetical protein